MLKPKVLISDTVRAKAFDQIRERRKDGSGLTRYGAFDAKGGLLFTMEASCFGRLPGYTGTIANSKTGAFLYSVVQNYESINDKGRRYTPSLAEIANERSRPHKRFYPSPDDQLRWYEFLLGPDSPWRDLHPWIAVTAKEANDAGFVFHDVRDAPAKLLYNFLIATRVPWEDPMAFQAWRICVDQGMPQVLAAVVNATLVPYAKTDQFGTDITAKTDDDVIWRNPWGGWHAFMSGHTYSMWSRFLSGRPREDEQGLVSAGIPMPVQVIWDYRGTAGRNTFKPFTPSKGDLPLFNYKGDLPTAIKIINAEVERQNGIQP